MNHNYSEQIDKAVTEGHDEALKRKSVESNSEVAQAVSVLAKALNSDPEFYHTWQSNIAMSLYDEFQQPTPSLVINQTLDIANRGAKKFLDLLISTAK